MLRDGLSDLNQAVRQAAVNALIASEDAILSARQSSPCATLAPPLRRSPCLGRFASSMPTSTPNSSSWWTQHPGSILGAIARTRQLPSDDQMIISKDFDGLSPYLDPTVPVSSERIADVAELLDADPEEIRARYRAIADRVGIMVPGWA